jgi:ABC-2 type transport system ATP-binding protein
MGQSPPVVICRGLVRSFGSQVVLDGIDLDVPAGTIVGLIGPSGCGKTTLMRILLGIREATAGEVTVLGRAPVDTSPAERARIGYLPQLPSLFPNLSLWNNLRFSAALYGVRRRRRRRRLHSALDFVGLDDDRKKLLRNASGGMQRRLCLAAAFVHDPELILLDEPTAGIDPILRERFWTYFRSLRDSGRTLIVSTQYVGEAADCDLVAVMCAGRIIALDSPDGLRRRAFGGDLIDVRPERGWLTDEDMEKLAAEPFVLSASRTAGGARLVVADATTATSPLLDHLNERDIGTTAIDQVTTDYDEIFVELIRTSSEADACQEPE